jgi:hypothetical protein
MTVRRTTPAAQTPNGSASANLDSSSRRRGNDIQTAARSVGQEINKARPVLESPGPRTGYKGRQRERKPRKRQAPSSPTRKPCALRRGSGADKDWHPLLKSVPP